MTSRRNLLKIGLAAAAWPIAARAEFASASYSSATVPLYKVLYDTRFPASVAFARRAEERGLAVHAMAGDMTRFWYDDLYHRWLREPAAIAGLTAHGALFCLERLAWDQRMRVVYRGEHTAAAGGCVAHRLEGFAPMLSVALEAATGSGWAPALAEAVATCPRGRAATRTARTLTTSDVAVPAREALFSWIIAPVPRA